MSSPTRAPRSRVANKPPTALAKTKSESPYSAWASTTKGGKPKAPKKKKSTTISASVFTKTIAETDAMFDSGDWSACGPHHLVALYLRLHREVYGVESSDLSAAKVRFVATMQARRFVETEFGGDYDAAIGYLDWLWQRERGREQWRRDNGKDGARLGPFYVFGGKAATDYRVAMQRAAERR